MNHPNSFWVKLIDKCFNKDNKGLFAISNDPDAFAKKIIYRDEYQNISENRKLYRLLIERYSNDTIGVYISSVKHEHIYAVFRGLNIASPGDYTMTHTYGPLSMVFPLKDAVHGKECLQRIMRAIECVEPICPPQIRHEFCLESQMEKVLEH